MANIKELLANMIGKINGKLNAPEQAAQPHQQLVTDGNGVAKWEERTHYSTRDESVLIEQTLNFEYQADDGLYAAMLNDTGVQFEIDKTYIVEWDGDVHSVQPIGVSMAGMTMVFLGNMAIINAASGGNFDDTGETFCIGKVPPEMGDVMQFFTSDTSNTHAVKVSAVTETIKTIDPKYLPSDEMVVRVWNDDDLQCEVADKTFAEIHEAIESEVPVSCVYDINGDKDYMSLTRFTPYKICFSRVALSGNANNADVTFFQVTITESTVQSLFRDFPAT